jgi:sugar phosphate permease
MSRMPIHEEFRMFHRLQFWRRTSFTLAFILAAMFAGLFGFERALIDSTKPHLRGQPSVEIMREPETQKIDNLTRI